MNEPTKEESNHRQEQLEEQVRQHTRQLQEAKQFSDQIIANAVEGIIVYDRQLRYLVWNSAMERLTGIPAERVLGKYALDLFPHLRERGVDKALERALRGETVHPVDFAYQVPQTKKSGWVSGTYGPLRDVDGQIIGAIGIVHDITERKQVEQVLRKNQASLEAAQTLAQLGSWELNFATGTGPWSKEMFRLFNLDPVNGSPPLAEFLELVHPDDRAGLLEAQQRVIESGQQVHMSYRTNPARGPIRYFSVIIGAIRDTSGVIRRLSGAVQDITKRKQAEDELHESRERLSMALEVGNAGTWEYDFDSNKVSFGPRFHSMLGYLPGELPSTQQGWESYYYPEDLPVIMSKIEACSRGETPFFEAEYRIRTKAGAWNWVFSRGQMVKLVAAGSKGRLVGIAMDITGRKILESNLLTMAHYDTLTQLPNRTLFFEKATMGLAHARRKDKQCAILFVDLDHFKSVNDTLGHSVGDELLKDTAVKLTSCIRETDVMARLGGDEFIVFLTDLESAQGAQHIAERIREKFNVPRIIDGNDLFITASVGIAVFPHDGDSLEDLLKGADTAMYAAKESGRNMYCFFDQVMHRNAVTKMQVERGLRDALDKKEFALFYQPIVRVADGKVRGFEALLRWFKTEGGLVFPQEFIPIAEETGLIVPIGEWVIHEACRFNKQLVDDGHADMIVSVNISVAQLRRKNLVDVIKKALDQSGLPAKLLEIEVTESLFIESFDTAIGILNAIRKLGVQVSLDDFGTGYSSLVHLQKLPIMNLKIDRLFIREIARDSDENAMIPAIIELAHKLKLGVVAEGVETGIQLENLSGNRCDYYQGYLFSKPIPFDQVKPFLARVNEETK